MNLLRFVGLVICFRYAAFGSTPSSVTLTASPNPANYGQPVTLTATPTAGATGKVTFYDGVTVLGTGSIVGTKASFPTVFLPSGARSLRAYYRGDGAYAPSSSAVLPQTVVPGLSSGLRAAANYPDTSQAYAMVLGDFNGDGKPDFATVDDFTKIVSVFLGNGDGTFRIGPTYTTVSTARTLVAADLNGDGKTDLVVANQNQFSGSLSVLLGNGDGTFQAPLNYPLAANPYWLAIADFNGDGIADVVTSNSFASGLSFLIGVGDGTFQPAVDYNVGFFPGSMAIADFDHDGYADIAVSMSDSVSILLGRGGTTFLQSTINNLGSGANANILGVADLNGDGNPDLLRAGTGITVLMGAGNGTFGAPNHLEGNLIIKSFAVEDFNGDGIPDVAAFDAVVGGVALLRGNGDGTFQDPINQAVSNSNSAVGAGDFNGDGTADVVVSSYGSFSVLLGGTASELSIAANHRGLLTQGQTGFTYLVTVSSGPDSAPIGTVSVVATFAAGLTPVSIGGIGWTCSLATLTCTRADSIGVSSSYPAIFAKVDVAAGVTGTLTSSFALSGGGRPNTVTAFDSAQVHIPSSTTLVSAPNPSVLGHAVTLTATVTAGASGNVSFFNGAAALGSAVIAGGHAVLSTSLLPSGTAALYAEYAGDSTNGASVSAPVTHVVSTTAMNGITDPTSSFIGPGVVWMGAADVNSDGKPDLVTVNSGSINVLLGTGDGRFAAAVSYPLPQAVGNSAAIGDFNGDGKLDVVVASNVGLFLLPGNGNGTFQAAQLAGPSGFYTSLLCADLDRDGKLDLVVIANLTGVIIPFLGTGSGTFQQFQSPGAVPPGLNGFTPLVIADMNGDGTPDLITLDMRASGSPAVLLGNGDGTFASPISGPPTGISPASLVIGDFNGDGKLDAAIPSATGIVVLLGGGNGGFQAPIKTSQSYSPTSFAAAGDFDGDGKLDLAVSTTNPGAIYLVFGNGDGTFRPDVYSATIGISATLAPADFNGDGKLDLAVSTGSNGSVAMYLGVQLPGLTIYSSHQRSFTAGKTGTYTLTVFNPEFPIHQIVTVTDTLPSGFTAISIDGDGWSCTLNSLTCTRSDVLAKGQSYPVITLTVNVAGSITVSTVTNQAAVTYAGATTTATDPTTILAASVTTLAITPSQSTLHQLVTLTATVSAGAGGSVMFSDNGTAIGGAPIASSQAVFTTRLLLSGLHSLVATYAGDLTHAPSTSAVQTISIGAVPANNFNPAANYATGAGPSAIATGDFNLDGIADLATANTTAGTVSILLGKGDGTFNTAVSYPAIPGAAFVVVGDFNNDGKPDIGVASTQIFSTSVNFLLGNGNGTFQSPLSSYVGAITTALGVADFFGSGQPALAATNNSNTNRLALAFLIGSAQPSLLSGRASVIADLNNDGMPDMTVWSGTGLYSFLGNGDGTFTPVAAGSDLLNASAIAVGDLNGDGKPDIVASTDQGVEVFLGNGDGTFVVHGPYATGNQSPSVFCTDVNGDGKSDVVVVSSGGGTASVLLGNGDGTLQAPVSYNVGSNPSAVVAGDFNGDGISDLAVANSHDNTVSVLLGVFGPMLNVTSSHFSSFATGQVGAAYTLTVTNLGGPTAGTVSVTDTLPAGLTATTIAGSGWTCALATLTCTRADSLALAASYPSITVTVNVTANAAGSVNNGVNVSGGGAPGANALDPTTIAAGSPITIATSPVGLPFRVDGAPAQTAPQTVNLVPGTHTIAVDSLVAGSPGTQYLLMGWSDSGAASHDITVAGTAATYTATFKTQYLLTTVALPSVGGGITPASGTYYDSGSVVQITATPTAPYTFNSWSGDATSTSGQIDVSMTGPKTLAASFGVPGFTCDINGDSAINVADVQLLITQTLGITAGANDLTHDGVVNVVDIQKEIGTVLRPGCIY